MARSFATSLGRAAFSRASSPLRAAEVSGLSLDIVRARAETPGCEGVIHFNNAGAALQPTPVLAAVRQHLDLEAHMGAYEAEEVASGALDDAYQGVAALLGANPGEIALMESATRGLDSVLYSLPLRPGDRIHASTHEYASSFIALLQVSRRTGAVVEVMASDAKGVPDLEALETSLDDRSRVVILTHVPASSGTVNPVAEVGAIARRSEVLYVVDACQSVGQLPIDVDVIGCDVLVGTGRKYLRGPRGTGFLYVRAGALDSVEPATLDYHAADWSDRQRYTVRGDARRYESFECAVAARIGLGVAVRYALDWGILNISERVGSLAAELRRRLGDIDGVEVLDRGPDLCGLVGFRLQGWRCSDLRKRLRGLGINTWVVQASATRLDLEPRGVEELVRASVHYYNTEAEVDRFCLELARC
jgi:cysteine desulfurase / selenocysteine lyase